MSDPIIGTISFDLDIAGTPIHCAPKNYGFWMNTEMGKGYEYRKDHEEPSWPFGKTIYEFTLNPDPAAALTFVLPGLCFLQPDRHFFTDEGSVPPCLQWLVAKDNYHFFEGFFIHDSAFKDGGLYVSRFVAGAQTPYVFTLLPVRTANRLLAVTGLAQGASDNEARIVYTGVQLGADLHLVKYGHGEKESWRNDGQTTGGVE